MKTLNQAQKEQNQLYYLLTCPHCGTQLVVSQDELHKSLFEPHEEEFEYWELEGDIEKKIGKQIVSSDPDKDVYKDIKCCYCGHVWDELVKDMYEKRCNPDGNDNIVFELGKVETQRVRDFIKKHNHRDDFKREGKLAFSTLGMQFTYTITPGGLGPMVSIKCNKCGESEDLTDVDNW